MTDNAAGMTVRAGCYFKFGMSIPLAKVPFLRHFGGDRGAPGADAAAGVAAEAAAEAEGRGRSGRQGAGVGVTPLAGGDDVVKASLDRKAIRLAGGETQQLVPKLVADRKTGCWD